MFAQTPAKFSPESARVWGCNYTHSKSSWPLLIQAHFTRHIVNQRTRENTELDVRPNTYVCPATGLSEYPRKPTHQFMSYYFKFNCQPQTNVPSMLHDSNVITSALQLANPTNYWNLPQLLPPSSISPSNVLACCASWSCGGFCNDLAK